MSSWLWLVAPRSFEQKATAEREVQVEYSMRYNVKPGKMSEFVDWVKKNDQVQRDHSAEGWTYLDTFFTVQGFGRYQCETRWEVDDYASLGAGFGDDEAQRLFAEWYGEFFDDRFPMETMLCKKVDTVRVPEGL